MANNLKWSGGPGGWFDVSIDAGDSLASIEVTITGLIPGRLVKDCGGDSRFCVDGRAGIAAFIGVRGEANASAKLLRDNYERTYSGRPFFAAGFKGGSRPKFMAALIPISGGRSARCWGLSATPAAR
jgi:hypothetical protein